MIGFRLDANSRIGAGHFFRSYSLALAMRRLNPEIPISFYGEIEGDGLIRRLHDSGFSWSCEFREEVELLVVDHYALGQEWEKAKRTFAKKILVIDDLANRSHDCDFLLDQNYLPETRYSGLIPIQAKLLCGPQYALLRPEFVLKREKSITRDRSKIRKVFVCFGGADQTNQTVRVLRLLQGPEFEVVVGPANPHKEQVEAIAGSHVRVYVNPEDVASIMEGCDLAVVSGGSIQWELFCLGVPVLSISIADNQEIIANALDVGGYCVYAGPSDRVSDQEILKKFAYVLTNPERRKKNAKRASNLVDGKGAQRMAELVLKAIP